MKLDVVNCRKLYPCNGVCRYAIEGTSFATPCGYLGVAFDRSSSMGFCAIFQARFALLRILNAGDFQGPIFGWLRPDSSTRFVAFRERFADQGRNLRFEVRPLLSDGVCDSHRFA